MQFKIYQVYVFLLLNFSKYNCPLFTTILVSVLKKPAVKTLSCFGTLLELIGKNALAHALTLFQSQYDDVDHHNYGKRGVQINVL